MRPTRCEAITKVESVIGYTFIDSDLLWEALQAPGSGVVKAGTKPGSRYLPEGNRRLAVYGDALLQLIIIEDWLEENVARCKSLFYPLSSSSISSLLCIGLHAQISRG